MGGDKIMERFKAIRPIAVAMLFGLLLFCSGYTKIDAHAAINWIRVAGSNTNYDKDFTIKAGNGTVSYKKSKNTLTLDNATIDASQMTPSHIDQKAGIEMYGGKWFGTSEFKIQLNGNNTIKVSKNQIGIYWDHVAFMQIVGPGTLTIDVSDSVGSYGLQPTNGVVHIQDGATVNIVGNPQYGYYSHGVVSGSQLVIKDATFNVTGKGAAIKFDNSNMVKNSELGVRVESGTLTATSTNSAAIWSYSGNTAAESAVLFVSGDSEVTLQGQQAFYYKGTDHRYKVKIYQAAGSSMVLEQGNSSGDIKDRTIYSERQNDLYLYETYGNAGRALGSNPYIHIAKQQTRNITVKLEDQTTTGVKFPAKVTATLRKNGQVVSTQDMTQASTSTTFSGVSYTKTSRFSLEATLYDDAGEDITSQYDVKVTGDEVNGYTVTVSGGEVEKDKLVSITQPADITLAHGLSWDTIVACLPKEVQIVTTNKTADSATVTFNTASASSSYDPDKSEQQVITISGTVELPDGVSNPDKVPLSATIKVTVQAKDPEPEPMKVATPIASLSAGTYDHALSVTLTSSTEGATIYYTTDGTTPSKENGTAYTGAIEVTGEKGKSVSTTIQAIAVYDGMTDSDISSYTYEITLPKDPDVEIKSVDLSVDVPVAGRALDAAGSCWTTGVATTAPAITWTDADGNKVTEAGYNKVYTATMTLEPDDGYTFISDTKVYVNGVEAQVTKGQDGKLTVSYTFDATQKDPLISFEDPQPLEMANGTSWEDILRHLDEVDKVSITTKGGTENWAAVRFSPEYAEPTYDGGKKEEQIITIPGLVTCPEDVDPDGHDLYTEIKIVVKAAEEVAAPYSPQESGTYDANLDVTLVNTEKDATVFYILNGEDPVEYNGPIQLTGTPGESTTYKLEVYAIKNGTDSSHVTYTYTIRPRKAAPAVTTIVAGERHHVYECHHVYEWETYQTASGTKDGEMRYRCKYCGDVQYTVPVTAYYTFNKETQEKVLQAAQGATVKVQTPWFISFHEMVYKALQERPDVTLVVDYKNEDALYEMTIPAGSGDQLQGLFGDSQFAGFLYLGGTYATTELPKDTVFEGISATEMWFGTTNAH